MASALNASRVTVSRFVASSTRIASAGGGAWMIGVRHGRVLAAFVARDSKLIIRGNTGDRAQEKTRATSKHDIEIAKVRYGELMRGRK